MLLIALVTALVGAWLYALARSGAQLESLFQTTGATAPTEPSLRAAPVVDPSPALTVEAPAAPPPAESARTSETMRTDADLAEPEAVVERPAGPIDAAAFAELIESGLLEEGSDPAAAEELQNALREAAAVDEPE